MWRKASGRIEELDFLKCVFIILMIIFHLVYIGDKYPYAKQLVYTFHMPGFLLISGYLANAGKDVRSFLRSMLWIFIPYAVMESGYVIMSSFLPVREKVETLSWTLWMDKLFLHPLGPYWYLHTLLLGSLTYYAVGKCRFLKNNGLSVLITTALCFALEAEVFGVANLSNMLYFLGGIALRRSGMAFTSFFQVSAWAVVPFVWLACYPQNLDRSVPAGAAIVYLAISLCLLSFRYMGGNIRRFLLCIGRNTLIILVFSPVFTLLAKQLVPWFAFEPSGMLFMCMALMFVLTGCFAAAWCMDKLRLSRFFFGKERILQYCD